MCLPALRRRPARRAVWSMQEAVRAKRASPASVAATPTMPIETRRSISNGGGAHRRWTWRVCIGSPLKRQLDETSQSLKIPVLKGGEDVNCRNPGPARTTAGCSGLFRSLHETPCRRAPHGYDRSWNVAMTQMPLSTTVFGLSQAALGSSAATSEAISIGTSAGSTILTKRRLAGRRTFFSGGRTIFGMMPSGSLGRGRTS